MSGRRRRSGLHCKKSRPFNDQNRFIKGRFYARSLSLSLQNPAKISERLVVLSTAIYLSKKSGRKKKKISHPLINLHFSSFKPQSQKPGFHGLIPANAQYMEHKKKQKKGAVSAIQDISSPPQIAFSRSKSEVGASQFNPLFFLSLWFRAP